MKLKAIAPLCAKVKQIYLFDDGDGGQWISDGGSAYRLPETLGMLTPSAVTAMFDIPPEKAADYTIDRRPLPEWQETDDTLPGEQPLNFELTCRITFAGRDLLPLTAPDGRVFLIQTKYVKPLEDAEQINFNLRDGNGKYPPVIRAKDGLFLTALIMPTGAKQDERVSKWAGAVASGLKARKSNGQAEV